MARRKKREEGDLKIKANLAKNSTKAHRTLDYA
jgi:hypothetical protein